LLANINALKQRNPGWLHKLYDDKDIVSFIQAQYPAQVLTQYLKIDPRYGAARADLFRYLLIYHVGGVYLDVKSSLEQPLDSVLKTDDQFIISSWTDDATPQYAGWGHHKNLPNGEFQQWHVAAAAGHPFLKAVIENILHNIDVYDPYLHGVGKTGVLNLTGPVAYSLAIAPILKRHAHRLVKSKSDLGFVYTIFKNPDSHTAVFKNHYMLQTVPIIKFGIIQRIVFFVKNVVRKTLRKIFCIRWNFENSVKQIF
jgi:inositol phosphorylceramide mannosyltransferase catalytic subunit